MYSIITLYTVAIFYVIKTIMILNQIIIISKKPGIMNVHDVDLTSKNKNDHDIKSNYHNQ